MIATVLGMILSGLIIGTVAVTLGGGATIGVPFLLLLGYSAAETIASVKFAMIGSFVTGTLFHKKIVESSHPIPKIVWPLSFLGSILGSNLVISIDDRILKKIIIIMMLFILAITYFSKMPGHQSSTEKSNLRRFSGVLLIFLLSIYSGFFGAGFGTFIIFTLMYSYRLSFSESASVMTRINLLVVSSSVGTFIFNGVINYAIGTPLLLGCAVGGILGAHISKQAQPKYMKLAFISFSLLLTAKLVYEIA